MADQTGSELSGSAPRRRTFQALRHSNFKRFYAANIVSNTGTWAQRIAQDWLVLELTGSGTALGIVTALQFLPIPLFSLQGGQIADRLDKRKMLLITNIVAGITALTLGLLDVFNLVNIWHVYVLAFILGTTSAIDGPIRQSFVFELVGPDDLSNAVSLNSLNFNMGRLIGPAVSGLIISAFGTGWSFLLNASSYIFVLAALTSMNEAKMYKPRKHQESDNSIAEGIRYLRSRADLLAILTIVFFLATFGLNFQMTMALMARDEFNKGASSYGFLGTCMAIGSVTGALISARRNKPSPRVVIFGAIAFGVAEMLSSFSPSYTAFAFALPLCGATALITLIAANTTMQISVPARLRGRVMGVYFAVFMGGTPLGSPIVGRLAEIYSPRFTLLLGGAVSAGVAIFSYFFFAEALKKRASEDEGDQRKERD